MNTLDVTSPCYDRKRPKFLDLQCRSDEQYGKIEEVQRQIRSIRQEKISGDNIYHSRAKKSS